jgi:hypothetical protein
MVADISKADLEYGQRQQWQSDTSRFPGQSWRTRMDEFSTEQLEKWRLRRSIALRDYPPKAQVRSTKPNPSHAALRGNLTLVKAEKKG